MDLWIIRLRRTGALAVDNDKSVIHRAPLYPQGPQPVNNQFIRKHKQTIQARRATGGEPGAAAEVKRWSAGRKKEVVLRLLRNEPVDDLSREVSVPIYKLEKWRDRALAGIDAGLKERENDPVSAQLDDANRRIGELVMEIEILRKERQAKRPLVGRRSSR